jgi:hypothetical protein
MALELYTTVIRIDADGDLVEYEAIARFTATMTSPGCRAQIYGDPDDCWPAESAEYELAFESAGLDPTYKGQHPLTDAEMATLRAWFVTAGDEAFDCANDNEPDGPDPDDARNRDFDDRMNGWTGDAA